MVTDRRIQETIAIGEINRDTLELVRNWCAHARIVKHGGVGMIEAQTGLPIGHHGLECDHAPMGGHYTWDLREAALDFHDRHCASCKMRKPVGFPNLSKLLKERDEKRAAAAEHQAAENQKLAQALEERRRARAALRSKLSSIAGAIVDHIDDFDEHRDREHRDRICESARLAPEHFTAPFIDYLFDLATTADWFAEAGVTVLHSVKADPKRLARLAMSVIRHPPATHAAATVLLDNIPHADATSISPALPAIIDLANPDPIPFYSESQPPGEPTLLKRLWAAHPKEIRDGLDQLLSSRHRHTTEGAARGILILLEDDPAAAHPLARSMVSKFARAHLLIDDFDEERHGLPNLRDAIVGAFAHAPEEIDAMVQDLINGSDKQSRSEAFKIYRAVLSDGKRSGEPVSANSAAHRIAFRRLLWASTTEGDEVLKTVHEVFQYGPSKLKAVARAEIDGLLGAVLIVDDRLRKHEEMPAPANDNWVLAMDRNNQRSTMVYLMKSFIKWASAAAIGDPELIKKVVGLFDSIPEGRNQLKGIALLSLEHLSETVDGLNAILPHLYYGLVGPSALVRAYAADALGEVRYRARENIPPLVYEAFSVLLWDQHVIVHKAAVSALSRFQLPDEPRGRAAQALFNLVHYYSTQPHEDRFIVDCVEQLAYELHRTNKTQGSVGKYLIQVLLKLDPLYVRSELRSFAGPLGQTEGFVDLLVKMLREVDNFDHREDEIDLLGSLTEAVVLANKSILEKAGSDVAPERLWLACHIVEALARAGAWTEARRVAEAGIIQSEATVRNKTLRLHSQSVAIAAAFEEAIAEGRPDKLPDFTKQWNENLAARAEHEADVKARNSRSGFPRSF